MLHTCESCGMDPADVHHCPNCNVPVGIPFLTTKRSLARAFITRLAGGYYLGTKMFHSSDRNLSPMSRSVTEVYNALHA